MPNPKNNSIAITYYKSVTLCLSTSLLSKLIVEQLVKAVFAMKEKKEINIQIGEQVKYAREQAKLTQEQLAEYIEVSPQYISDLERGVVGISITTLKRLCEMLHITSDQILFSEKPKNDISAITEKCRLLPKEQFNILSDIINKFIEAINIERQQKKQ